MPLCTLKRLREPDCLSTFRFLGVEMCIAIFPILLRVYAKCHRAHPLLKEILVSRTRMHRAGTPDLVEDPPLPRELDSQQEHPFHHHLCLPRQVVY